MHYICWELMGSAPIPGVGDARLPIPLSNSLTPAKCPTTQLNLPRQNWIPQVQGSMLQDSLLPLPINLRSQMQSQAQVITYASD